jgi:hypothetical protein
VGGEFEQRDVLHGHGVEADGERLGEHAVHLPLTPSDRLAMASFAR